MERVSDERLKYLIERSKEEADGGTFGGIGPHESLRLLYELQTARKVVEAASLLSRTIDDKCTPSEISLAHDELWDALTTHDTGVRQ